MLKKKINEDMGHGEYDWLKAIYHFSFDQYYSPSNMQFGVLRVLNDDLIEGKSGFETHPHNDMEIVTYVVEGTLTHEDSMGNRNNVARGQIQYMSAGTGVYHSEHNLGEDPIRSLQIWILPEKKGLEPNYGDYKFNWELRKNKWLHMVSGTEGAAPVKINQDANFYALELEKDGEIPFSVDKGRQAYLVQIEGKSKVNNETLNAKDALEIVEEDIVIKTEEKSHFLVIEMAKA